MSLDLPLVLVNPASRGGRGGKRWPAAAVSLRSGFGPFECRFTKAPGDATHIAEEESRRGRQLILVFGGDGTISETANGLLRAGGGTEMGVLPNGTGSDFVRSLELPGRMADLAAILREGVTRRVDVGRARFDGGERYFLNAASFGLSGEVAHDANRSVKRLGGTLTFAASTARAALRYGFPRVEITWDGGTSRRLPITTVSLHNGSYFGGGMLMAPGASLTDGRLDAVVIKKLSVPRLFYNTPLLYAGAHQGLDEVQRRAVQRLEARTTHAKSVVRVETDGESLGVLPAMFEIIPAALPLRVPRRPRS